MGNLKSVPYFFCSLAIRNTQKLVNTKNGSDDSLSFQTKVHFFSFFFGPIIFLFIYHEIIILMCGNKKTIFYSFSNIKKSIPYIKILISSLHKAYPSPLKDKVFLVNRLKSFLPPRIINLKIRIRI